MNADYANTAGPTEDFLPPPGWPLPFMGLLLLTLLLTACLEDIKKNNADNGPLTGQLTLIGVEGVGYQTESKTGTTDAMGRFQYLPGQTVSFSLGDLVLGESIPAGEFLTPLEFTADQRALLTNGADNTAGLSSHRTVEEFLVLNNPQAINIMRLLMVLDQNQNASVDNPLQITQRSIQQINHTIAQTPDFALDFRDPPEIFARAPSRDNPADTLSNANRLLQRLCFYPQGHELCDDPPSDDEINRLRPDDPTDPGSPEYQALVAKKAAIESARREMRDVTLEAVRAFLLQQTDQYKLKLERPYTLIPDTLRLGPQDNGLKDLKILRVGGELALADMEVESTDQDVIRIHGYSAQTGTAQFHLTSHASHNDEATVLVNFKRSGDYRWYRKSLLVRIDRTAPVRP